MKTDIYPRRPDSAVSAPEPIESPIPQVLIPEVRQHARRRRLRNLAAVLISGATAAGLLLFLGSGSPAGSRASRPSSPSASGATHTKRVTEACNKAAPRGPHAWPVLTAGQAVVSDARGRYMAVVYHPTGSRVFACITNGSGGTATEDSSFGQGGIPKPGADEITNAGGGAGAAPGSPEAIPITRSRSTATRAAPLGRDCGVSSHGAWSQTCSGWQATTSPRSRLTSPTG